METAGQEKYECLICGKRMALSDLLNIKTDKTRSQSSLQEIVFQILDRKRVENVISLFLCRICSNLLSDFEEHENRARNIKTEISQRVYRRLVPSFSSQNAELEPGELEDLNDFIEDNIKVFEINVALKQEEIKTESKESDLLDQEPKQKRHKSLSVKKKQEYGDPIELCTNYTAPSRPQGKRQIKPNMRYAGELCISEEEEEESSEEDTEKISIKIDEKWRLMFPNNSQQLGTEWRTILSSKLQERHPCCLVYFPSFSYNRDNLYFEDVLLTNIHQPYFEATGLCHIENCDAVFKIKCNKINWIDVTLKGKVENIITTSLNTKEGHCDNKINNVKVENEEKLYTMSKSDYEVANICQCCLQSFQSKEEYLVHMANSHKGEQESMFSCHGCMLQFKTASSRNNHYKSVHMEPSFECKKCYKKFLVMAKLKVHQKNCVHGVRHICTQCNKTFINERNLRDHTLVFHEKIQNESSSKYHFPCKDCNKIFYKKSNLQSHMLRHSDTTPFHCSFADCGKGFKREKTLNKHIQLIHEGIKEEYLCGTCGQQFGSQSGLKTHQARHIGEEYIKRHIYCPDCNKPFRCQADLKVHSVVHSKNKPFACDLCGQSFSQKASLKDHQNVHLNLYQCGGCEKSFGRERYLKQHQRTCAQFNGNSKQRFEENKIVQFFSGDQIINSHQIITDAEILAADGTSTGIECQVLRSASGEVTVLQTDNVAVDEASGNLLITDPQNRQEVIVTESPSGDFLVSETSESQEMSESAEQGLVMRQDVDSQRVVIRQPRRKSTGIRTDNSVVMADEGQLVVTDTVQEIMVTVENEHSLEGSDQQRQRLVVAEGPVVTEDSIGTERGRRMVVSDQEAEDTSGHMLIVANSESFGQQGEESMVTDGEQRLVVNNGKLFKHEAEFLKPLAKGRLVMVDSEESLGPNKGRILVDTGDHTFSYHSSPGSEESQTKRLNIDNEVTYLQREQVTEYSVESEKCQSFVVSNGTEFRNKVIKEAFSSDRGGQVTVTADHSESEESLLTRQGMLVADGEVFGNHEMMISAESQTIVMTEKGERVAVVPGQFVLTAGRTGLLVRDGQRIDQSREPSEQNAGDLEDVTTTGYGSNPSTVEVVKKGSEVINQPSETVLVHFNR